jgi:hypothetical protein
MGSGDPSGLQNRRELASLALVSSTLTRFRQNVAKVVELTGFSRRTVTRIFEDEKSVLILKRPEILCKRSYRGIRIPGRL